MKSERQAPCPTDPPSSSSKLPRKSQLLEVCYLNSQTVKGSSTNVALEYSWARWECSTHKESCHQACRSQFQLQDSPHLAKRTSANCPLTSTDVCVHTHWWGGLITTTIIIIWTIFSPARTGPPGNVKVRRVHTWVQTETEWSPACYSGGFSNIALWETGMYK